MIVKQKIIVQATDNNSKSNDEESYKSNLLQRYLGRYIQEMCRCLFWSRGFQDNKQEFEHLTQRQPQIIPPQSARYKGKKTLVLDLDETLVHSSFTPVPNPDLQFELTLDGIDYVVYVKIRPGTFTFLKQLSEDYEIFIYTASIHEYADPVINHIDPYGVVSQRLFRENCTYFRNVFVKDLSNLNRDIKNIIIVDVIKLRMFFKLGLLQNSPNSFLFQPMNALQIRNFFDDMTDQDLYYTLPFLKLLKEFQDVRPVHEWWYRFINFEKFSYINVKGQKVEFQLCEEQIDLESQENSQLSEENDQIKNNTPTLISKREKGRKNSEQNTEEKSQQLNLKKKDNKPLMICEQSGELPLESNLSTPKIEEDNKFILPVSKLNIQKSIIVTRNREFLEELDERIGLSTEGADQIRSKHSSINDVELRNRLNINSPKEYESKKIIFPQDQE